MANQILVGMQVRVTGATKFSGTVRGAGANLLSIALDNELSVLLRREPASTTPEQWRLAGLPVTVAPLTVSDPAFAQRLKELEEQTRDYIDPDEEGW